MAPRRTILLASLVLLMNTLVLTSPAGACEGCPVPYLEICVAQTCAQLTPALRQQKCQSFNPVCCYLDSQCFEPSTDCQDTIGSPTVLMCQYTEYCVAP